MKVSEANQKQTVQTISLKPIKPLKPFNPVKPFKPFNPTATVIYANCPPHQTMQIDFNTSNTIMVKHLSEETESPTDWIELSLLLQKQRPVPRVARPKATIPKLFEKGRSWCFVVSASDPSFFWMCVLRSFFKS